MLFFLLPSLSLCQILSQSICFAMRRSVTKMYPTVFFHEKETQILHYRFHPPITRLSVIAMYHDHSFHLTKRPRCFTIIPPPIMVNPPSGNATFSHLALIVAGDTYSCSPLDSITFLYQKKLSFRYLFNVPFPSSSLST